MDRLQSAPKEFTPGKAQAMVMHLDEKAGWDECGPLEFAALCTYELARFHQARRLRNSLDASLALGRACLLLLRYAALSAFDADGLTWIGPNVSGPYNPDAIFNAGFLLYYEVNYESLAEGDLEQHPVAVRALFDAMGELAESAYINRRLRDCTFSALESINAE